MHAIEGGSGEQEAKKQEAGTQRPEASSPSAGRAGVAARSTVTSRNQLLMICDLTEAVINWARIYLQLCCTCSILLQMDCEYRGAVE